MRLHSHLRGAALLAGALALCTTPARADVIPSGYKGVKLSIEVEADVPEGHALLLLNTFDGFTRLVPGKTIKVGWHPMAGEMQLVRATTAQVAAIEAIGKEPRGDERMAKMQAQSKPCSEPFDGVRTVKDTERYDEVRWHYTVSLDGQACKSELVRTSYLADGDEVKPVSSAAPSAEPSGTSEAKAADRPEAPAPKPASSCAVAAPSGESNGAAATFILLAGLALLARSRRCTD